MSTEKVIFQGDNQLFISDDQETVIICCCCGDMSHGTIKFESKGTFGKDGWYDDELIIAEANFAPVYGWPPILGSYRLRTAVTRLKACWRILTGQWSDVDFNMNGETAKALGEWLIERSDIELEKMKTSGDPITRPKKLTLSDIRAGNVGK